MVQRRGVLIPSDARFDVPWIERDRHDLVAVSPRELVGEDDNPVFALRVAVVRIQVESGRRVAAEGVVGDGRSAVVHDRRDAHDARLCACGVGGGKKSRKEEGREVCMAEDILLALLSGLEGVEM